MGGIDPSHKGNAPVKPFTLKSILPTVLKILQYAVAGKLSFKLLKATLKLLSGDSAGKDKFIAEEIGPESWLLATFNAISLG